MFQSDFKIVADYFSQIQRNGDYQPLKQKIKHVDEVLKLFTVLTGDDRFQKAQNELKEERGAVTMCEVLDKVEKRGIEQGAFRMLIEFAKDGTISIQKAAEKAGMDIVSFEKG